MGELGFLGHRSPGISAFATALMLCACASSPAPTGQDRQQDNPHYTRSLLPGPQMAPNGQWTSPWSVSPFPFDQLLPSWNVSGTDTFRMEIQVTTGHGESPWLDMGGWGSWPAGDRATTGFAGGQVEIDLLKLKSPADRARIRLRSTGPATIDRLTFCFTRSEQLSGHDLKGKQSAVPALPVPQHRQTDEAPELAARICSPTAVNMLLAFRGVRLPTAQVARELFDRENDIYGNWNRAVQGAARFGVGGYLTRTNDWNEAAALLSGGQPLIASIAAGPGQLTGAPYKETAGHLIVICGLDGNGRALVLDPAVPRTDFGLRAYALKELDGVWLGRGGFTYVLGSGAPPGAP